MGGGLEIAAACHVRVADESMKFRMPEGQRGIFVGGGATVRLGDIIGADRLTEMMLTGRTYSGAEGASARPGPLSGAGWGSAGQGNLELAEQIAQNSATVNYLIIQSIARIARHVGRGRTLRRKPRGGAEPTGPDAEEGLRAFLEKRKPIFI